MINEAAAERIRTSNLSGAGLLSMFESLAQQMRTIQAQGNFVQFSFIDDPTEMKEGDLIPELHLSLRPFAGHTISMPAQIVEE